jgi:capsular exopolysaccharide synthesis family protein
LAFVLSQLNKRVLLIDCDMRRPTLAEKLGINKMPGLANYLTVQSGLEELIQNCGMKDHEEAFHVITAGQNPPNPIELLSSERMHNALHVLRHVYDYVILDLPPVCEVSDAMAVANETDGMLLVVRQNYCNRIALNEFIRQFEFIGAKVLGVVFNCANEQRTGYGKGYYKRYYKSYHRQYGKAYANTGRSVSDKK